MKREEWLLVIGGMVMKAAQQIMEAQKEADFTADEMADFAVYKLSVIGRSLLDVDLDISREDFADAIIRMQDADSKRAMESIEGNLN